MAQIQKIEQQTKIKSSPDRLFDIYKNKICLLPQISPDKVRSSKLIEGDGKSIGSVSIWNYFLGRLVVAKVKIDTIDEQNNKIIFDIIDGEVNNHFKSIKVTLQTVAETDINLAKWTMEYEKINDNIPSPHAFLDFNIKLTEDVDSYLLKP